MPETRAPHPTESPYLLAALASPDALLVLRPERDATGDVTGWTCEAANDRAAALLGEPRDRLAGTSLAHLVGDALPADWPACAARALRDGTTATHEVAVALADGRPAWLELYTVPLGDRLALTARDVTARKAAELLLREQEALYRSLARNFPRGTVLLFDRDLRFRVAEGTGLAEVGLSRERVVGRTVRELFPAETCARLEPQYRAALAGQSSVEEVAWDGRTYLRQAVPVRDDHGVVVGGLVVTQDISERKAQEEALRRARDEAEAASRAKSDFLARMSHELRTPLNAVIGFANVLRRPEAPAADAALYLDRIAASGRHLLGLIDEILDLARIEAGRVEVAAEPVALPELLRETVTEVAAAAGGRPVELRLDLPETAAPVTTDPAKVRQVVRNLVGNALKFTERGHVTVRLATDPASGEPTCIEVADTGIGIAPERCGAVFEAFEQGDPTIARRFGGTGLGLSIARSLCAAMGYRLDLESVVGRGSVFRVHLRAA